MIVLMIVLGIFILGIMVLIHEAGHFFAAKSFGVNVMAFSIGFGKVLLKKKYGETEYRLSAIPFGGYVKMAGENPDEDRSDSADEFQNKPIWQRAVVAVAGPAANFLSAIVMLWVMFLYGVDRPSYLEYPIVGGVSDSSAARNAGIVSGDSVVRINGKVVSSWEDMENAFMTPLKRFEITIVRDGRSVSVPLVPEPKKNGGFKYPPYGLIPPMPAVVGRVMDTSAAAQAGLETGDTIISINSRHVRFWPQLTDMIQHYGGETLQMGIVRGSERLTVAVTPRFSHKEKRWLVGISPGWEKANRVRYSAGPAFQRCLEKTWSYTTMIFDVLGKLVSRQVSADQLSGPVGIIPASGFVALQGLSPILNFMALISINLAVLNLFPLIITDGGMLLFLLLEAIRRKPLSIKTQMAINRFAIAFFILLFLYITFNDINRLPEMYRIFSK